MTHIIQETSIQAYHEIKPRLSEMKDRVIDVIYERPFKRDFTNREIAHYLHIDVCCVTPRVCELRKKGVLVFNGKRMCSITQKRVMAWRLTWQARNGGLT